MSKEEIGFGLKHELIKALNEQYQKGFVDGIDEVQKLENNTLTVEIPKGYKTLDTRELSEGERHWIEVDLMKEEDMCKIRQPHTGFPCKCNNTGTSIGEPILPSCSCSEISCKLGCDLNHKHHIQSCAECRVEEDKPELPEETEYPLVFLANNHLSILGKARIDINKIIRYLKAREK